MESSIGIIGLAVMGSNLARNLSGKSVNTVVFNRSTKKTEDLIKNHNNEYLHPAYSLKEFTEKLERPRKIILMVKSGPAIDEIITQLLPFLEKDDIILDFGNSFYHDTEKRAQALEKEGIAFIGCGISGGEEGALNGPSLMPGGNKQAYEAVSPILEKAAAKDFHGEPCVTYLGPGGAGHFVKMVHNGIEYGIMQLIAETYHVLRDIAGARPQQIADFFEKTNKRPNFQSFLMEITAKIFHKKEEENFLIDLIKSAAGQKGTGKWTTEAALNYGVATPTINTAVDARIISGSTDLRRNIPKTEPPEQQEIDHEKLADALELATIITYAQGFELLKQSNLEEKWEIDLQKVLKIWQGGCIIRSRLLDHFENAIKELYTDKEKNLREITITALQNNIPFPAHTASIAYFDALRTEKLPQNLIQAQRDFFGAHTYQRIDKEGVFHTEWQ